MDKVKTGNLIRDARKRKNYTQSELGDLLGVTNKAVSWWENGESFPDVGILESISKILDIKIQDIIVGEVQLSDDNLTPDSKIAENSDRYVVKEENMLTELVRLAKIQDRARYKTLSCFLLQIAILLYSCFVGYLSLLNGGLICSTSGMFYFVSFAVVLGVMVFEVKIRQYDVISENNDVNLKCDVENKTRIIAWISFIWIILSVCVCCVLSAKARTIFGVKIQYIGVFLNVNLVVVFLVNLVFWFMECVRNDKQMNSRSIDFGIPIAVVYLAALYGDMLHHITGNIIQFYNMIFQRTAIVLIELLIFNILAKKLNDKI